MVDMHQDVFARTSCGEGFPDFYAKDVLPKEPTCFNKLVDRALKDKLMKLGLCVHMPWYGFETDESGYPLISECQTKPFFEYYSTPESLTAFDALYNNKNGLQDLFVAYWDILAQTFSDNEFVIGFDPLNEPGPSLLTKHPSLFLPGNFEREELAPMYSRLHEVY